MSININQFNNRLNNLQNVDKINLQVNNNELIQTFLGHALPYLKKNCNDAEIIAHFLMGKVKFDDLPLNLKNDLVSNKGSNHQFNFSADTKSIFFDLLRTHRYNKGIKGYFGRKEDSQKTIAKLTQLNMMVNKLKELQGKIFIEINNAEEKKQINPIIRYEKHTSMLFNKALLPNVYFAVEQNDRHLLEKAYTNLDTLNSHHEYYTTQAGYTNIIQLKKDVKVRLIEVIQNEIDSKQEFTQQDIKNYLFWQIKLNRTMEEGDKFLDFKRVINSPIMNNLTPEYRNKLWLHYAIDLFHNPR